MIRVISRLLTGLSVMALGACASSAEYPSLALRSAERISGSAQVVTPEPPPEPTAAPSADFTARLAQLVGEARDSHQVFTDRRGAVERAIAQAAGAAAGSENWSVASTALAELDSARSTAMVALAEIDRLYAAEAVAATESGNAGNAKAAADARVQVDGWVAEEDAILARLGGHLAG